MKSVKNPAAPAGKKNVGFADRLSTAAAARKAELDRCRARLGADDPAVAGRQAADRDAARKDAK